MNLDDLIEYESENTSLDFKAEEYGKNNFELIKDVMSMANAHSNEKKYIVVGVKDNPNEDREWYCTQKIGQNIQLFLFSILNFKVSKFYYF